MIQKAKHLWTVILGGLMSLLGLSSCSHLFRAEYGCPHVDFKFIGEATGDGKPVEGIRVVLLEGTEDWSYAIDTSYTDASGRTERDLGMVRIPEQMYVKFEDVDGPENGSWQTKIIRRESMEIVQTEDGDGRWDRGDYTVTAKADLKKAEQ